MVRRSAPLLLTAVAALAAAQLLAGVSRASAPSGDVHILTPANRADLISGSQTLVQVVLPPRVAPGAARVQLNGADVTSAFTVTGNTLEALLSGLTVGQNHVVARLADGRGATLTITDHPIGGPVFAGPQIQPWACPKGSLDRQCDAAPTYSYLYKPAHGVPYVNFAGQAGTDPFQPYDPRHPPAPSQIATTTTTNGTRVPFIVRKETGYIDRDQYAIAVLFQPGKPWHAWAPQPQFNRRLVITHGASCDTDYGSGTAPDVLDPAVLGAGFIVMSNALDNAGHNCDIVTQAESLVMTKERVIDQYGELRWTIGSGCSGGSLVQQQVANAYPGLYQGITPQCSFTDAWSSAMEYLDYDGFLRYAKNPSRWDPGEVWTPPQISEIIDHPDIANPVTFTTVIPNSADPSRSCPDVPQSQVYNAKTNPKGLRCTLEDYMVNVFGRRPDGLTNIGQGNVGVQYGLKGLRDGIISPAQFVDLNSHVGGFNRDDQVQPQRSVPDLAGLVRAYTSGAVDSANNLNQVAIIDLRGPDPGFFHDVYRTYAMRARLLRNFGTAANQVLWRGQSPIIGDVNFADQAIFAVDKWLGRVATDPRTAPLPQKIIEDRPGDVADRCTDGFGKDLPSEVCDETVAAYGTPRIGADMPLTDDILQCQLKPLRRDDYPVSFTAAQWARLQATFPTGVCDYSKPGVGQQGTIPWLTYQDSSGRVIYGGQPMGPAPVSQPVRRR